MTSHVTFQQGVKECIPTLLGYIGIGLSFGIVAASQDFSVLEILLLCLLVYAGAAIYYLCFSYYWYTYISNRVNNVNCEFRFFYCL